MFVTVFNTTTAPITVDPEGRQIGGRDWGTVDTTQDLVKPYLEPDGDGSLVRTDVDPSEAGHPDAIAAAQRTEIVSGRAAELQSADKSALAKAAKDAGVPDATDLSKSELVHALANRPDVRVPEPQAEAAATETPEAAAVTDDEAVSAEQPGEPDTAPKSRRSR